MVQKPVLFVVLILVLASLACSLFSRGRVNNEPVSGDQVSGEQILQELGCSGCHGIAAGNIAPPLDNVYGSEVLLESSETVVADDTYLRESILTPGETIVAGYQPLIPDFSSQISAEELDALVGYIRSLSD